MFKILLFDLDGTLIRVDMKIFIKEYFRELGDHLSHIIPPLKLQEHLKYSTRVMIENQDPGTTNREVFWKAFSERVDNPRELLEEEIENFYRYRFKNLKVFTDIHPRARQVLAEAQKMGHQLVLATNPVFPFTAIRQRMEWGKVHDFPYQLITSYENMHFCKPSPGYFQEILDKVGGNPRECLMIGNDIQEDLAAARLGIKTFLVEDFLVDRGNPSLQADYRGKLEELSSFLGEVKEGSLKTSP
ncbi:MAG: HAD family hydrolase [Candidatus Syntrophonatronum acetioxidans]|uniref:HAD family hydrolase n=1 Tax=Candidatus Syntrophonatronum acetioxidans TaxID=1795816 RepID=A0A424YET2_9FIRM|nr:MAG: HAD family hydrolase [Candidatus Syntrophonatronum acetioxidans]